MLAKTDNPYTFKYLQTGFNDKGILTVYLPSIPKDIANTNNRFVKPTIPTPKAWAALSSEAKDARMALEWDRRTNGYWFYNNGVPTYITGAHYFYLTAWNYLGYYHNYRETDKELFYFWKYIEEDESCYGMAYCAPRRSGKSAIMGTLMYEYVTAGKNRMGGIQGRNDDEAKKFYQKVKTSHLKVPVYFKCQTDGHIANQLSFTPKIVDGNVADIDFSRYREGIIDYRTSLPEAYDGSKLHRYLVEEPGKACVCDVWERHQIIKPCLREGSSIIGKAIYASTTEDMDNSGANFRKLVYASDPSKRDANNQTESGLYACMIPAYYALEFDEYGFPKIDFNRKHLDNERKTFQDHPRELANLIRKYPFTWAECFYHNADKCLFNITILNDRKAYLTDYPNTVVRGDLVWENRDSEYRKVSYVPNPQNGRFTFHRLLIKEDLQYANNCTFNGYDHRNNPTFSPNNNATFCIGIDPIDWKASSNIGGSRPAMLLKKKYDPLVDGAYTNEELLELKHKKHFFKTGVYYTMYDKRPRNSNEFFEDVLKLCHYAGCQVHIERNKTSLIQYMEQNGAKSFIMGKWAPRYEFYDPNELGTPTNAGVTDAGIAFIDHYIQFFGHTIPFVELIEDLLSFDAENTRKYDLVMAMIFTELAQNKPKYMPNNSTVDISKYFNIYRV